MLFAEGGKIAGLEQTARNQISAPTYNANGCTRRSNDFSSEYGKLRAVPAGAPFEKITRHS